VERMEQVKTHYSPRATLVAVGAQVRRWRLFNPIRQSVQINQKTIKHSPWDKLYDGFIALLAGAQGLVEINKRVRSDVALQAAFGRDACAEQSVVQDTLDACSADNVAQMECAWNEIYRQRSRGYGHRYSYGWRSWWIAFLAARRSWWHDAVGGTTQLAARRSWRRPLSRCSRPPSRL
jgi:hypothetical protein